MEKSLLKNIHVGLTGPGKVLGMVHGDYEYYHYGCDGVDDRGWGCGYRTLQTMCSWIRFKQGEDCTRNIPTVAQIQESLVKMEDKSASFIGSREWIGSFEVALVVDFTLDVPCKIVHVRCGAELCSHIDVLLEHYRTIGAPVMMGGDTDNSSKGILGVSRDEDDTYLLVLDPHYYGEDLEAEELQRNGWIKWVDLKDFSQDSFYNLCLPQYKEKER